MKAIVTVESGLPVSVILVPEGADAEQMLTNARCRAYGMTPEDIQQYRTWDYHDPAITDAQIINDHYSDEVAWSEHAPRIELIEVTE